MSNKTVPDLEHSDSIITNEDTRIRRAWIDRALAGVRSRFDPDEDTAEPAQPRRRPRLYVVDSNRSG